MKPIKRILYLLIIILNIICIYLVIDFSNYDEMVGYLKNGSEKIANPKQTALVFLFTCIVNLLFICANFMKSLIMSKT